MNGKQVLNSCFEMQFSGCCVFEAGQRSQPCFLFWLPGSRSLSDQTMRTAVSLLQGRKSGIRSSCPLSFQLRVSLETSTRQNGKLWFRPVRYAVFYGVMWLSMVKASIQNAFNVHSHNCNGVFILPCKHNYESEFQVCGVRRPSWVWCHLKVLVWR